MNKCVCDICGIDNPQKHYKIKERKLMHSGTSDYMPIISWERIDVCDSCFNNLIDLRYEKSLERRIYEDLFSGNKYQNKYPNEIDLQSAYLEGVEDVINMLIQNKVIKANKT